MPPQVVTEDARIKNSCVTEGCYIDGDVSHSVIFTGVNIEAGARVENSIILPYAKIERGAYIKNAVVGESAHIGAGAQIGMDHSNVERQQSPMCVGGITLVGKRINVAAGAIIESGVMLDYDVEPAEIGK